MRWQRLQLVDGPEAPAALFGADAIADTVDSPEFAGLTFYVIHAKSIINRVPAESRVPFRYTVNPYRGCSHACTYCFARKTHEYLNLGTGADFDSKVIVKANAGRLLRRELAKPSWRGEAIAMGTNVDCYQRAEGRYRLMPAIIEALRDAANPFSILTKGTLILRDLELLRQAASVTQVSTAVSVSMNNLPLWRSIEPGTPRPGARLAVCEKLNAAGIECSVLLAPILPFLTDSPEQLRTMVSACADAGATAVTPIVLHLRSGAREWFLKWLWREYPGLVADYQLLYSGGSYADKEYQAHVSGMVNDLAAEYGIPQRVHRPQPPPRPEPEVEIPQPTLF
ncbi:Rv2578c family radical SAM protein [Stackebrandtia nassauensis]|uniref:Radical SAM domain protein n=1 Tax=Stackebrandtia nassauensis (strain DSM 44728 / CIP 108903 / NRRL B-16338 / NBRC 102104 / LLR-40K-21) TaxID=446470 RepID=D3Q1E1_STANL|nr:Rv2578c family radical SAM protein [Stackebrandtia nassauensis]ADD45721.1 Radical SAM domain protein [Stackebrandtia nassauensis DSM 44728]